MSVRIRHITVDCANPYELSLFWGAVTGFEEEADGPNEPGEDEALLLSPDGSLGILFVQGPESKTVKNRIHLDFQPTGATRDAEVERTSRGRGGRTLTLGEGTG